MESEIRILIVEDEPMWAQGLAADLHNFGYTVTGTADTFEKAIALLNKEPFDIALLDINLNGSNSGIEIGKLITNMYRKPFIFITSNDSSMALKEAIEANPSAYLIKPANPSSLVVAIQNALNNFSNRSSGATGKLPANDSSFFFVKHGDKYKKIFWKDVVYLRAERNYTLLFNATDKTEYPVRSSLIKTFTYILPPLLQNNFLQVNRSEIVQLSYTQELAGDELRTAYKGFTVSESFAKELKKQLNVIG